MLKPSKHVFLSSKYVFAFAKATISVVHTGVKHASLDEYMKTPDIADEF